MGSSDIKLIERLRNENLEQFFTLVRMHLSFVVDINSDEVDCSADKPKQFRWNFHKKIKTSNSNSSQNNASNTKKVDEANSITEDGILRLYELIDFLSQKDNVIQEGIFRRTGSLSRQQELRQLLATGSSLGLEDGKFSVHDCASVLKGFLAELPQPLLMDQYYQTYCTLASQYPPNAESSEEKLLTALQLLLLLLAPSHRKFLERLLRLLRLVADHERSNRMSPDTLATMFTPHLLCPRKLSPETFHAESIAVSPLVSFMIRQSASLFVAPPTLATDAAAYFTLRERHDHDLDDSITDRTTANTVYTFVDRHRTRAENESNPTDTALAQLCAHIQGLPDSHHKRRLVKHFNRQNGYGTPIQIQRTGKVAGSRSFGDSIKRHIFNKGLLNKTPKKGSGTTINVIEEKSSKSKRLTDSSRVDVSHKNIVLKNLANKIASTESLDDDYDSDASDESTMSEGALDGSTKMSPRFVSEPNLSSLDSNEETPKKSKTRSRLFRSKVSSNTKKYRGRPAAARSTPTCVSCVRDRDSDDDHQDHVDFTVRYSTSTPGHAHHDDRDTPYSEHFRRASMSPITKSTQKLSKAMQESIMTPRSRKPLIITSERAPAREAAELYESMSPKNDSDFVSSDDDRSTFGLERSTRSASTSNQSRAPEPRSDSVSASPPPTDDAPPTHAHAHAHAHTTITTSEVRRGDEPIKTSLDNTSYTTRSLTEPFRDYLLSRSVLAAHDSSALHASLHSSLHTSLHSSLPHMSSSLLYCLDGHVPEELAPSRPRSEVDSNIDRPLRCNVNIDLSPRRGRRAADGGRATADKENISHYDLRETDL